MTPLAWQYISLWISVAEMARDLTDSQETAKHFCFSQLHAKTRGAYYALSSSEQQAICNLIQGKTLDEVRQAYERKTP